MLAQVAPVVSASETATASECASIAAAREPFAIIQLSVVRALAGNCTRSAILIYNALATHADPTGHCWPGRARLADITGLSERQVSRATAELERKGLLTKESLPAGRVDYWLLPAPTPVTTQTLPPDTGVTPPLTPVSPITDQLTDQTTERAAPPEPEPPPPAPSPPGPTRPALSDCQLQARTHLAKDWRLPDDWKDWAINHRPDLTESLEAIAANFFDFHTSKGTRSSCWMAEWRRWIRRERAPRTAGKALTATRNTQPYPTPPNQPKNAVSAAVDTALEAAVERSHQAFYDLCRSQGIDPATGLKIAQPHHPTTKPAAELSKRPSP